MQKHLTILSLCFFTLAGFCQNDTIKLTTGRVIVGSNTNNYLDCITIADTNGVEYKVRKALLSEINVRVYGKTEVDKSGKLQDYYYRITDVNDLNDKRVPYFKYNDIKTHLTRAGRCGVAAASLTLIGGVFTSVGILKNIDGLFYSGVTINAAGFIMLFPTFSQLIKAGKAKNCIAL